jgi:hypothetical protein
VTWLFVLLACGDEAPVPRSTAGGYWPEPELPSCDVAWADREEATQGDTCVAPLSWHRDCDEAPGELTQEGLVFAGALGDFDDFYQRTNTFTVTDAETWEELARGLPGGDTLPAVDFETSIVLVALDHLGGSCGLVLLDHGLAFDRLFVAFEDRSGACGSYCDTSRTQIVAYAIPRERGFPRVCATVVNTCEP